MNIFHITTVVKVRLVEYEIRDTKFKATEKKVLEIRNSD